MWPGSLGKKSPIVAKSSPIHKFAQYHAQFGATFWKNKIAKEL